MAHPRLIASLLGLAAPLGLAVHAAPAPPPPDAGQTLRGLQPENPLEAPEPAPAPPIETKEAGEQPADGDFRVFVRAVEITGNREVPLKALTPLVAGVAGAERSLTDLRAAAARITRYYRQHGYAVARAYVPAQDVKDGVVTIGVLEGHIGQIRLDNHSRLSDERARAYLDRVKDGGAIKSGDIDRGLLLLDDTPGVGGSRAALQPGASVGASDLLVTLTAAPTFSGNVSADNYGNRYTGEYQFGGALDVNGPLRVGDLLTLGVLTSGRDLQYGRIAYQLPIGADGLRVGLAFFDLHYRLGKEFGVLDAHGDALSGSVFAVYPFIRGVRGNLTGTAAWEEKSLDDDVGSTDTVTDKRVHLADLGLSGDYRDAFGGGGVSSLQLSLALGRLDINSAAARMIDDASARTRGDYARLSYDASRVQHLTATTFLRLALSGQFAGKNLDSSEKFQLGGIDGVRAYPQGEGVGDEGYVVKLEAGHDFARGLRVIGFYDTGSVTISKTPFGAPGIANRRDLAGAGLGVNITLAGFELETTLAWRTQGGEPNSIPGSAVNTPTVLARLTKAF